MAFPWPPRPPDRSVSDSLPSSRYHHLATMQHTYQLPLGAVVRVVYSTYAFFPCAFAQRSCSLRMPLLRRPGNPSIGGAALVGHHSEHTAADSIEDAYALSPKPQPVLLPLLQRKSSPIVASEIPEGFERQGCKPGGLSAWACLAASSFNAVHRPTRRHVLVWRLDIPVEDEQSATSNHQ